jgi:hypothetical protein
LFRLCQATHFVVELALLLAHLSVDQQQRFDDGAELVIFPNKDSLTELQSDGSSEQQSILFDHATDLILDITADRDETRSRDKDGANPLAIYAFDLYFTIPSSFNQFLRLVVGTMAILCFWMAKPVRLKTQSPPGASEMRVPAGVGWRVCRRGEKLLGINERT